LTTDYKLGNLGNIFVLKKNLSQGKIIIILLFRHGIWNAVGAEKNEPTDKKKAMG
jgi:hypothetical protein